MDTPKEREGRTTFQAYTESARLVWMFMAMCKCMSMDLVYVDEFVCVLYMAVWLCMLEIIMCMACV